MADVYTCDNYVIKKIEAETMNFAKAGSGSMAGNESDDYAYTSSSARLRDRWLVGSAVLSSKPASFDFEYAYYVTVQRLPESTYPNTTDVHILRGDYLANLIPLSLSEENFINNVSVIVNTALAASDAAFDGSAAASVDKTGYTVKLGG